MQWPIPPWPTRHVYNPRASGGNGFVGITTGSPANTKGPWVTLVPGTTTNAASWAFLNGWTAFSSFDSSTLMDIAIGDAGSETIVAANLILGWRRIGDGLLFPLHVPAGATVRGRLASLMASVSATAWSLDLYGGEPDAGLTVPGKITTYGAVPASSAGTAITPNSTANVKGSYAQLAASTTSAIHALMVLVQGSGTISSGFPVYNIDIAVGGSGSETPVIRDHVVELTTSEEVRRYASEFVPLSLNIPAGVRLSARCSTNAANSPAIEVAVYGFTY